MTAGILTKRNIEYKFRPGQSFQYYYIFGSIIAMYCGLMAQNNSILSNHNYLFYILSGGCTYYLMYAINPSTNIAEIKSKLTNGKYTWNFARQVLVISGLMSVIMYVNSYKIVSEENCLIEDFNNRKFDLKLF